MKTALETIAVAFSMFSALPMPQFEWNSRNMKYALCAFPLVGAVVGLSWWLWAGLCGLLDFPALLRGAGFCLLPVVITGGIHLDGFADTSDALASYASPERRREILKDSHCGAFAVIRLCSYFVGYLALCAAFVPEERALLCMALSFVLSRSLSGFAVAALPIAGDTGLVHTFADAAQKSRVRLVLGSAAVLLSGGLVWLWGLKALALPLAALLVLAHYAHTARTKFGGISGDLAGWFLQRAEFWMLAAMVLVQYGEELL